MSIYEKEFLVFAKANSTKTKLLKKGREVKIVFEDSAGVSTYTGPLGYNKTLDSLFIHGKSIPMTQVVSISYGPLVSRTIGAVLLASNVAIAILPFYLQYHLLQTFSEAPLISAILMVASAGIWLVQIPYAFLSSAVYNIHRKLDVEQWTCTGYMIRPGFKGLFKPME